MGWGMLAKNLFILFILAFVSVHQAHGFDLRKLDEGLLSREFSLEKKEMQGHWASNETWKGYLCEGSSRYEATLQGRVDDVRIHIEGPSVASLAVDIGGVRGNAFGSYRSSGTLCIPFSLGIGLWTDRIQVRAVATMEENGGRAPRINVKVLGTHFGVIHFGKAIPPALENFLTKLVNTAFSWIWNSRIGTWLSVKVSDAVNYYYEQHPETL